MKKLRRTDSGLVIEADLSRPAIHVGRALDQRIGWRRAPTASRCDNGQVYTRETVQRWARARGIRLDVIPPDQWQPNACIESYHCGVITAVI